MSLLYYPHYTPSDSQLRSLLLLFDDLQLIVPSVDQEAVSRRPHLWEILEEDHNLARFVEPDYYLGWVNPEETKIFKKILSECIPEADDSPIRRNEISAYGYARNNEALSQRLQAAGWATVALQKLPGTIGQLLFRKRAGAIIHEYRAKGSRIISEHSALLTPRPIADFLLSRIARSVSHDLGIPSLTFNKIDYRSHSFDKTISSTRARYDLLKILAPLVIPDKVETLPINHYFAVRRDFEGIRRSLGAHMQDFVAETDLTTPSSIERYLERLHNAAIAIGDEVGRVEAELRRSRRMHTMKFGLELGVSALGGALGAALAGPFGGALAAAGTYVVQEFGVKAMFNQPQPRNQRVQDFARLRGRILADAALYE